MQGCANHPFLIIKKEQNMLRANLLNLNDYVQFVNFLAGIYSSKLEYPVFSIISFTEFCRKIELLGQLS
jgi:hypothetical protein